MFNALRAAHNEEVLRLIYEKLPDGPPLPKMKITTVLFVFVKMRWGCRATGVERKEWRR